MRRTTATADASRGGGAVLCVADDPDVRSALVGLVQELGIAVQTVPAPTAPVWCGASLVLLDPGAAVRLTHLPRRRGVLLVCDAPGATEPDPQVWRAAVDAGADRVVVLPTARGWLAEAVAEACRPRGVCVGVVGARGGAGATSTAVALAAAAVSAGRRVLLVDADPWGGGVDLALGAEELSGHRWEDLHDLREPLPPGGLGASLPTVDGVVLLSYGRRGPAVEVDSVRAVLRAGVDEHELVVVDLPRSGDPLTEAAAARVDVLLCVCPCEVRAVASAPAVIRRFSPPAVVHLLVRGPSPGGLRPGEAAAAVRAGLGPGGAGGAEDPVQRVDSIRAEPGLAVALERGEAFAASARSPLRRWAADWVRDLPVVGARSAA